MYALFIFEIPRTLHQPIPWVIFLKRIIIIVFFWIRLLCLEGLFEQDKWVELGPALILWKWNTAQGWWILKLLLITDNQYFNRIYFILLPTPKTTNYQPTVFDKWVQKTFTHRVLLIIKAISKHWDPPPNIPLYFFSKCSWGLYWKK